MSTYNKMKKRRDHWKKKTVATGADLRYHKKENKRIKKERDAYRRAWRDTKKELDELKQRNTALAACDKTTTVFLALQLFVVARIGFRAISRVLGVLASQLGLAQAPCPQTIINWVTRLAIARMKEDRFGVDPDNWYAAVFTRLYPPSGCHHRVRPGQDHDGPRTGCQALRVQRRCTFVTACELCRCLGG
jgi:hypothetical protein